MNEPRAYTEEEIREKFLSHVNMLVKYWSQQSHRTEFEKLDGLAFSILSSLDGSAMALPGFKVIPNPHPDDKQYHIDNGENWYPDDIDIAGGLHELMGKYK